MPAARNWTDEEVRHVKILAQSGCTFQEIASMMDCDEDTISKYFSVLIRQQREAGKGNVRYWRYKRAKEGSDKMLLHLSKHWLGEHDIVKLEAAPVLSEDAQKLVTDIIEIENEHPRLLASPSEVTNP